MPLPAIVAFDIETVPDTEVGRRVLGFSGTFLEVCEAMAAWRSEQTDGRSDFLKPPYHRIVAIAAAWIRVTNDQVQFRLKSLGDDPRDEADLLQAFFTMLRRGAFPTLVSWNGHRFDLPVIAYRSMLHGVDASPYYAAGDRYDNYRNRFGSLHTDLMDVLAAYSGSDVVKLDELCQIMGLPGKTVTEGHRVFQHIARDEWALVETYCELDALNTLMLYLAWLKSRGDLTTEQFSHVLQSIAGKLSEDQRADVQAYGEAIETWQPGFSSVALRDELEGG